MLFQANDLEYNPLTLTLKSVNLGGISYPRTPGLGETSTMAELLSIGGTPSSHGVILAQNAVNFSDIWVLSDRVGGIEYVLTRENGHLILRSGAANNVKFPSSVIPIAHTHPLHPITRQPDKLPSFADISALNLLWARNPDGPRPMSYVIWGPDPGNITRFRATHTEKIILPDREKKRSWYEKMGL